MVTGSTVDFNSAAVSYQTIPAFNYYNLTSSSTGPRLMAVSEPSASAGTFTPTNQNFGIGGTPTVNFNGPGRRRSQRFPITTT